jgi:perosamine synthetase
VVRDVPFGKPMLGAEEKAAVAAVLEGTTLTHGPLVKRFEVDFAAFTGAPHAVAVSSATAGLHLAYFHLGIGPGDEVIVPAQTHVATAHAVEYMGAKPVFVDAERETGNIRIDAIETAISQRTKALSIVHYLGMPVDMHRITAIAERHGLFVVEDCALAIGTYLDGTHAGLFGDVGAYSFYPVKHITTAEGGMVISRRADVAGSISLARAFGIDRNIVAERPIPGTYDVQGLGFNYRLNELGAALGIEQVKRIPAFLDARRANYEALQAELESIPEVETLASSHDGFVSSHYCHLAILTAGLPAKRYEIMASMKAAGVGTSIYYPRPVPMMTYYREKYGYRDGEFPGASRISDNGIALPVGPHLTPDDMRYVADALRNAIMEVR